MMINAQQSVQLLGTRGTMPCAGPEYQRYGGDSICVQVNMANRLLLLDAGTGLIAAPVSHRADILLSHAHMDHLLGLTSYPGIFQTNSEVHIYACPHEGRFAYGQIKTLLKRPYWSVDIGAQFKNTALHDIKTSSFDIGKVHVEVMEGDHPGGSTIYRLSHEDVSVVYAIDFEHGEKSGELAAFAKDCTLLLYDAQYTDEEYESKKGCGHSTWEQGVLMGERANARETVLIHHAPGRTDAQLDRIQAQIRERTARCRLGYARETILL
ncbi:MBL fold metallo-hydrolase [Christensenellaceae bacterium OttesenSCG-928-M15]|nr:MBL fold metallo-hydrolase [Christensenellaceae bacterium OttesenSCG-928-M15]